MQKVIDFEDKGIKFVLLKGGKYLIDGEVVTVNSYNEEQVGVKDENKIRKISETKGTSHYIKIEDKTKKSKFE